jgi:hypothetical protein
MMKTLTRLQIFIEGNHRIIFYSCWLIIHFIQASATELFDDEAYYWVYSKFPAWGYFDHPSLIAFVIKAGYFIFPNELGVRLFPILLNTASIFLTETLLEKKNAMLFYAICLSLAIAQVGGMMAVPDTILMFFVALFFIQYKRFNANMNLMNSILLGVCMALMLYTKYQAVLVIIFTAISNIRLTTKFQAYFAILIAFLLFLPHLYWQYENAFPSVQFHLFERNSFGYEASFTLQYIIGQLLIAGPVAGWLLIYATSKYKPASPTESALKFTFVGFYLFFLFSTLKGKAEANWTIPSFIGLIVLSHQYLNEDIRWRNILFATLPFTIILVISARAIMMADLPPAWWMFKDEFHGNKILVQAVRAKSRTLPVIFLDSYQKPSKYWFYSGDTSMALNTPYYRRNNFNYWNIENQFIGRKAYVVGYDTQNTFKDTLDDIRLGNNRGRKVNKYYSFSRMLFYNIYLKSIDSNKISIQFTTITPPSYLTYFSDKPYDSSQVYLVIYKKQVVVDCIASGLTVKEISTNTQTNFVSFDLHRLCRGNYIGKFAVSSCIPGHPSLNSAGIDIHVQ